MAAQPTELGPYTILSRLGRGGMGTVYEATDTRTGAAVAVKILASHLADDPGLRKRFEAEIETLKSLRHPSIVQLLAFGEQDGQPYFAMELVRGRSLEQVLRSGRRFTWRETVAAALAITRALKVAHDHGVVHRDLKPANLLIADEGEGGTVAADGGGIKLADFGIAKLFGGAAHTAHGTIVGTAEYMAPEQAAGRPVDHRADIYALGMVMFAMLTGRPPFSGETVAELMRKQQREAPRRVATLVPDMPPELDQLIDRMLAKDPAQRPARALAAGRLLAAIETVVGDRGDPAAAAGPSAERIVIDEEGTRSDRPRDAATDLDRSRRSTVAGPGPVPEPQPGGGAGGVDLLGPTRDFTAPAAPATPGAATDRAAGRTTRLPTATAEATTQVDRTPRNRFMTVEELDRANREQADRERRWQRRLQIATSLLVASLVLAGAWLLLRPPTADELHDAIMAIASDDDADLRDARGPIDRFLREHGDDPRAEAIGSLDQTLDLDALEKRARRRVRVGAGGKAVLPIERDYRAAMDREAESPSSCRAALEALVTLHEPETAGGLPASEETKLWIALARRQAARLEPAAALEREEDARRIGEILAEAVALETRAAAATDEPQRAALADRRRRLLESVVEIYAERPHAAEPVAAARRQLEKDQ
jgi:serine/threonine-protein kinase